jgi:putative copper resistance protein D
MIAALSIVRAVHLLALMPILGSEALHFIFARSPAGASASRQPARWPLIAAVVALLTAILWLDLTAATMSGDSASLFDPSVIWAVLTQTFFGEVFVARFVALVALVSTIAVARASKAGVPLALSALALVAISLTSHAAASGHAEFMTLRTANDALHLLCASFWIGGLVVLLPMAFAKEKTALLVQSLRVFSRWAMAAVAVLVATGSLNAYLILFADQGRWSLTYISLLAAKITLAALMVAIALANRFGLLVGIEKGETSAKETLALSVVAELALGIVIVGIAGLLGISAPRV